MREELIRSAKECPRVHSFIFVWKFGKLTQEETDTLKICKEVFPGARMILAATHCDNLYKNGDTLTSIAQHSATLESFLDEFAGYVMFSKDRSMYARELDILHRKIDEVSNRLRDAWTNASLYARAVSTDAQISETMQRLNIGVEDAAIKVRNDIATKTEQRDAEEKEKEKRAQMVQERLMGVVIGAGVTGAVGLVGAGVAIVAEAGAAAAALGGVGILGLGSAAAAYGAKECSKPKEHNS
jgi:hypothetical protein